MCSCALDVADKGTSHNNLDIRVGGGVVGMAIGALAFPLFMYRRTRSR